MEHTSRKAYREKLLSVCENRSQTNEQWKELFIFY